MSWAEDKAAEMFKQIGLELTLGTTNYVGDWIRRAIRETIEKCAEVANTRADEYRGWIDGGYSELACNRLARDIRKLGEP